MSNLELIERLCALLKDAGDIIREQAELMTMHGIRTEDGRLEERTQKLIRDIENQI